MPTVWFKIGEAFPARDPVDSAPTGVARFRSDGELDGVIDLPASFVSSLSFGGPDTRDVLISTADNHFDPVLGGALLRARSEVAGLSVPGVEA